MSWRERVGTTVEAALAAVPVPVWDAVAPRPTLALCYHVVSDGAAPHVSPLFEHKTPDQFDQDVRHLRASYDLVTDDGLARRLEEPPRGGRPAVAVTFDDGLRECHAIVRPILERHGARAIFFLTTACLDNQAMIYRHQAALCVHRLLSGGEEERRQRVESVGRGLHRTLGSAHDLARLILRLRARDLALLDEITGLLGVDVPGYLRESAPYLTRAQALELAREGHALGAHGVTHRDLQDLSAEEVEREIVESCDQVAALSGRSPVAFAAPFSLEGLDRTLLQRIRRAHPQVGWIYGTSRLRGEPHGLFNRVVADSPRGSAKDRSNVPRLFRSARASQARLALARIAGGGGG